MQESASSARLAPARACVMPALASAPVDVRAGTTYTAFATVRAAHGGAAIGLRYLDSAGGTVGEVWSARRSGNEQPATMRADAKAPSAATSVRIVVATTDETYVDDVLVSARFTDLGNQVKVDAPPTARRTAPMATAATSPTPPSPGDTASTPISSASTW